MRTAFICNPSAQWRKKQFLLLREIHRLFPQEHEFFGVDRALPDSLEQHLEKIVHSKFDRIVVAGGDGTVNRTIQFLLKKNLLEKFVLGIVPMGTCNDFARYLGLKSGKIKKAFKVILKSKIRKISIAQVNGVAFFNNAGFGKKNPTGRKKSAVQVLREMEPVELCAEWGTQVLEGKFFMMLCANAPYFSGGLHFSKNSDPQDEHLEFYFVRSISKARLLLRLLLGRFRLPLHFPVFSKEIVHVKSSHLSLRTDRPVSIVADGEPVSELLSTKQATFQLAGTCNFLVPA